MRVDIVIPVHNGFEYLDQCLDSIFETAPRGGDFNVTIRLFDNGSDRPVLHHVASRYKERATIPWFLDNRTEENVGVTIPWNFGLRHALADGADIVCIANTDVVFGPKVIEHCCLAIRDHECAAAFPLSIQGGPIPADFKARAADAATRPFSPETIMVTGGFAGWCFFLSRETVAKIGEFDEQFTLWYQDTDYHDRLAAAGMRPREIRNCLLHHFESRTILSLKNGFAHKGWQARDAARYRAKCSRENR